MGRFAKHSICILFFSMAITITPMHKVRAIDPTTGVGLVIFGAVAGVGNQGLQILRETAEKYLGTADGRATLTRCLFSFAATCRRVSHEESIIRGFFGNLSAAPTDIATPLELSVLGHVRSGLPQFVDEEAGIIRLLTVPTERTSLIGTSSGPSFVGFYVDPYRQISDDDTASLASGGLKVVRQELVNAILNLRGYGDDRREEYLRKADTWINRGSINMVLKLPYSGEDVPSWMNIYYVGAPVNSQGGRVYSGEISAPLMIIHIDQTGFTAETEHLSTFLRQPEKAADRPAWLERLRTVAPNFYTFLTEFEPLFLSEGQRHRMGIRPEVIDAQPTADISSDTSSPTMSRHADISDFPDSRIIHVMDVSIQEDEPAEAEASRTRKTGELIGLMRERVHDIADRTRKTLKSKGNRRTTASIAQIDRLSGGPSSSRISEMNPFARLSVHARGSSGSDAFQSAYAAPTMPLPEHVLASIYYARTDGTEPTYSAAVLRFFDAQEIERHEQMFKEEGDAYPTLEEWMYITQSELDRDGTDGRLALQRENLQQQQDALELAYAAEHRRAARMREAAARQHVDEMSTHSRSASPRVRLGIDERDTHDLHSSFV